ncbi:hypothetical protein GN956_G16579 [Arapaima gigas]
MAVRVGQPPCRAAAPPLNTTAPRSPFLSHANILQEASRIGSAGEGNSIWHQSTLGTHCSLSTLARRLHRSFWKWPHPEPS